MRIDPIIGPYELRPVADEEALVLLFEPASTLNTGNVQNERTLEELEKMGPITALADLRLR